VLVDCSPHNSRHRTVADELDWLALLPQMVPRLASWRLPWQTPRNEPVVRNDHYLLGCAVGRVEETCLFV